MRLPLSRSTIAGESVLADVVIYRQAIGWPSAAASRIYRKIGALQRHGAAHIKIGITNKPARRWREDYAGRYTRMHVIYMSSSHDHVCQLEKLVTRRFDSGLMTSPSWYYNERSGGGGPKARNGPYFLYLVTAPRWFRASR